MGLLESKRILNCCSFLAAAGFALLSAWYFQANNPLLAALYAVGLLLFLVRSLSPNLIRASLQQQFLLVLMLIYTSLSIILLATPTTYLSLIQLSLHFAYPLIAFGLLGFRLAIIFVVGFALAFNLLIMLQLEGTLRAAVLTAFWLITLLSSINSFAHLQRQLKLKHFLSKDPTTGLLNQQQLEIDLNKEIERAKRELTALALVKVRLSDPTNQQSNPLVKKLQASLAAYERLYYTDDQQLIILLPLGEEQQLTTRLERLRSKNPELPLAACCSTLESNEKSLAQLHAAGITPS